MNGEVHPAIGEPSDRSKVSHADDFPLDDPEATIGCQREQDHTVTASSTHPSQTTAVDNEHMKIVRRRNQNRIAQMLHRKRREQQIKDLQYRISALESINEEKTASQKNLLARQTELQRENTALRRIILSLNGASLPGSMTNPELLDMTSVPTGAPAWQDREDPTSCIWSLPVGVPGSQPGPSIPAPDDFSAITGPGSARWMGCEDSNVFVRPDQKGTRTSSVPEQAFFAELSTARFEDGGQAYHKPWEKSSSDLQECLAQATGMGYLNSTLTPMPSTEKDQLLQKENIDSNFGESVTHIDITLPIVNREQDSADQTLTLERAARIIEASLRETQSEWDSPPLDVQSSNSFSTPDIATMRISTRVPFNPSSLPPRPTLSGFYRTTSSDFTTICPVRSSKPWFWSRLDKDT